MSDVTKNANCVCFSCLWSPSESRVLAHESSHVNLNSQNLRAVRDSGRANIGNGPLRSPRHLGCDPAIQEQVLDPPFHSFHGRGRSARRSNRHHGWGEAAVRRWVALWLEPIASWAAENPWQNVPFRLLVINNNNNNTSIDALQDLQFFWKIYSASVITWFSRKHQSLT